jgi:hypothetical protein
MIDGKRGLQKNNQGDYEIWTRFYQKTSETLPL